MKASHFIMFFGTLLLASCITSAKSKGDVSENQVQLLNEEENQIYYSNIEKRKLDSLNLKSTQMEVVLILPGEVDNRNEIIDTTNFYNTYFLHFKNGDIQMLSYEYSYNIFQGIDSATLIKIDTLQHKVRYKDL
jgi:hypothetical protein